MSIETSSTDQNVARALRANLQGVQRQSEELHQAIADLVAACSSNRPANALPHLVRAEASAASLAAVLAVLAKFVAGSSSSTPARRVEDRVAEHVAAQAVEHAAEQSTARTEERSSERVVEQSASPSFAAQPVSQPENIATTPAAPVESFAVAQPAIEIQPVAVEPVAHQESQAPAQDYVSEAAAPEVVESASALEPESAVHASEHQTAPMEVIPTAPSSEAAIEEYASGETSVDAGENIAPEPILHATQVVVPAPAEVHEPLPIEAFANSQQPGDEIEVIETASADSGHNGHVAEGSIAEAMGFAATQPAPDASLDHSEVFDINVLPADQQEMHRRANRVAKVSMQDIQLLRPDLVQQGRVTKDICIRLRDEIEKARREYERRFRPILGQGADYFYHWMVEVLGAGDPETLGEYPYHAPVLRH